MEAFISQLIGLFLPPLVNLFKEKLHLSSKDALAIIGLIIGVFYTVYMFIVPEAAKEQILMFATSSIGTAVMVHEHLIKRIKD